MKDRDILVPYITTGLKGNEYCIWVFPEFPDHEDAKFYSGTIFPILHTIWRETR